MSGKTTPILCGAIPTFEEFMTAWESLKEGNAHLAKYIKPGLKLAYNYYTHMDDTWAYIIMMCTCLLRPPAPDNFLMSSVVLNPISCMMWIHDNWDKKFINMAEKKIWQTVSLFILGYPERCSCLSPLQDAWIPQGDCCYPRRRPTPPRKVCTARSSACAEL